MGIVVPVTSPSKRSFGRRVTIASSAERVSSRARCDPRQKWIPKPKPRWPAVSRVRSKRSGSGQRSGHERHRQLAHEVGCARTLREDRVDEGLRDD
jgi:hypothetical protein